MSVKRLAWLQPLVEHLKSDVSLSDVGKWVFPMSEYRGITEANQFTPSILVIPRDARLLNQSGKNIESDCASRIEHRILICVVVKNPINCRDHIEHDTDTMYGAYIEACDLELKLRESILSFNGKIREDFKSSFSPLQLLDLPEPDELNGHFVLAQNYSTTFTF